MDDREETVNVKCDYRGGLQLRLFHMMEAKKTQEPPRAVSSGKMVAVKYGFNPGVSKKFWDQWWEQNKETSISELVSAEVEERRGGD